MTAELTILVACIAALPGIGALILAVWKFKSEKSNLDSDTVSKALQAAREAAEDVLKKNTTIRDLEKKIQDLGTALEDQAKSFQDQLNAAVKRAEAAEKRAIDAEEYNSRLIMQIRSFKKIPVPRHPEQETLNGEDQEKHHD